MYMRYYGVRYAEILAPLQAAPALVQWRDCYRCFCCYPPLQLDNF